jgi:hypothetical protein
LQESVNQGLFCHGNSDLAFPPALSGAWKAAHLLALFNGISDASFLAFDDFSALHEAIKAHRDFLREPLRCTRSSLAVLPEKIDEYVSSLSFLLNPEGVGENERVRLAAIRSRLAEEDATLQLPDLGHRLVASARRAFEACHAPLAIPENLTQSGIDFHAFTIRLRNWVSTQQPEQGPQPEKSSREPDGARADANGAAGGHGPDTVTVLERGKPAGVLIPRDAPSAILTGVDPSGAVGSFRRSVYLFSLSHGRFALACLYTHGDRYHYGLAAERIDLADARAVFDRYTPLNPHPSLAAALGLEDFTPAPGLGDCPVHIPPREPWDRGAATTMSLTCEEAIARLLNQLATEDGGARPPGGSAAEEESDDQPSGQQCPYAIHDDKDAKRKSLVYLPGGSSGAAHKPVRLSPGEAVVMSNLIEAFPGRVNFSKMDNPPADYAKRVSAVKQKLKSGKVPDHVICPGDEGKGSGGGYAISPDAPTVTPEHPEVSPSPSPSSGSPHAA